MPFIRFVTLLLIVIGALNWGLWGFLQYDMIQDLLGTDTSILARAIYGLVGIAGLYGIRFFFCPCVYKSKCKVKKEEK